MKKIFSIIFKACILIALCLSFSGCELFEQKFPTSNLPDSGDVSHAVNFSTANPEDRQLLSRVQAVEKVERSVVAIKMTYETSSSSGSSSGSGVIIDNGNADDNIFYVLTCHHVISSGGKVEVFLPDTNARNYTDKDYDDKFGFEGVIDNKINTGELTLIGGDQKGDVAVLKLDVTGTEVKKEQVVCAVLPPETSETESAYKMMRGEEVFAIGNPSGKLPMSVASGIISYIDRQVTISDVGIMDLLQIDVQTNHGSSGGGLFNHYGELIGITNAGSDAYEGLNYAIPYTSTRGEGFVDIAKELVGTYYNVWKENNHGYVSGRWSFGITIAGTSTTATILESVKGGNAYKAGLRDGDLICGFSCEKGDFSYNEEVKSKADLEDAMNKFKYYLAVGDFFTVKVSRNGIISDYVVNLTEQMIFMDTGYRGQETQNV